MRDLTDCTANQELLCGHFPKEKLIPLDSYCSPSIDEESIVLEGIKQIIKSDYLPLTFALYTIICENDDAFENVRTIDTNNYWINLGLAIDRLDEKTETTELSKALFPAVTLFDKVLWLCALSNTPLLPDNKNSYNKSIAWCFLLRYIQRLELTSGNTINMDAAFSHNTLMDTVRGNVISPVPDRSGAAAAVSD